MRHKEGTALLINKKFSFLHFSGSVVCLDSGSAMYQFSHSNSKVPDESKQMFIVYN